MVGCLFGGLRASSGGLPLRWAVSSVSCLSDPWAAQTIQKRIARPSGKPAWAFLATALMGAAKTPFCPPLSRTTPRHSGTIRVAGPIWANLGQSGQIWAPTPFGDRHRGLPRASSTATVHAYSAALPEGYYIPVTSKSCSLKSFFVASLCYSTAWSYDVLPPK